MTQTTQQDASITTQDILDVAKLSRLAIKEHTASEYAADIQKILTMMDTLADVDTDNVQPLCNVHDAYQVLRPDVANANIDRDLNQQNAPAKQDGLFLVPKVIE